MTLPTLLRRFFATVILIAVAGIVSCGGAGGGSSTSSGSTTPITSSGTLAITTSTLAVATYNAAYADTVVATGGKTPYTFALNGTSLPAGLSLNAATGVISGVPTQVGQGTLSVKVTDSAGATAIGSVALTSASSLPVPASVSLATEAGINLSPGLLTPSPATGTAPYTVAITAGSLPAGLSVSSQGVLTGIPASATSGITVTLVFTDSKSVQVFTSRITFVIYAAFSATGGALPSATVGVPYSAPTPSTTIGGYPPYTSALASGSLPPGLSLANNVISGTPTTVGSYAFTVTVRDNFGVPVTVSHTLNTFSSAPPLKLDALSLPFAYAGQPYGPVTVTATGGNTPYTYSLAVSYNTTSGLVLSPAGVLSGTANCTDTGFFSSQYAVVITVKDAAGRTDYATSYISCKPIINLTPASLPEAVIGSQYYGVVSFVPDSSTPAGTTLSYALSSGSLPIGISLSSRGVFSGIPVSVSTSSFSVSATSPDGGKGTRAYNIKASNTLSTGGYESLLNGAFAFSFSGYTNNAASAAGTPFARAMIGRLVFDGAGGITGSYDSNSATDGFSSANTVTGSYRLALSDSSSSPDAYQTVGTMILKSGGKTSTYTFRVGDLDAAKTAAGLMRFVQFDNIDVSSAAGTFGSGVAKRQSPGLLATDLTGTYVTALNGESASVTAGTLAGHFGGIVSIATFPADGTTSPQTGAVQDLAYYSDASLNIQETATTTLLDGATGRGTVVLTPASTVARMPTQYSFFAVSPGELYLLSSDSHAAAFDLLTGTAKKQIVTTYTPSAALSGSAIIYSTGVTGGGIATAGTSSAPSTVVATLQTYNFSGGGAYTRVSKTITNPPTESGVLNSSTTGGRYVLRANADPATDILLQMIDNNTAVGFALRASTAVPLGILNLDTLLTSGTFPADGYLGTNLPAPVRSSHLVQSSSGNARALITYALANQVSGSTLTTDILVYPPTFFNPFIISGNRALAQVGTLPIYGPNAAFPVLLFEH